MRLLALSLNNHNLIFSGSPLPALALAKAAVGKSTLRRAPQGDTLCVPPPFFRQLLNTHTHTYTHTDYKLLHIHTHICIHFPIPIPRLRRFEPPAWQAGLWLALLVSCWTGWLLARAGLPSPVAKSCVYGVLCAFCWGVFPVLTLYSPRSIVWGLFFSSSLSSCLLYFSSKNPCISLLIVLCMIVYVTNKPTLTLTSLSLLWQTPRFISWFYKAPPSEIRDGLRLVSWLSVLWFAKPPLLHVWTSRPSPQWHVLRLNSLCAQA